ncbi:MAG: 2-dehydropantoate 2-reductase [Sulfitobacter sp.]
MNDDPHIVVAGAGAIGCFVGGLLAAGGMRVTLLLRPHVATEIRAHGLTLTDFSGLARKVSAEALELDTDPACLADADIVLVTVKSGATAAIGRSIAAHAPASAHVVSLQNGTENAEALRALLPHNDVRAGMVPFNVVPMGQGCFHRATSGDIVIGTGEVTLAGMLSVPHLSVAENAQITGIQWGKFLINLNNALNALSGLTLQEQLRDRAWRKLMADQWAEALNVLKASGIDPIATTPLPIGMVPSVLRLPTPMFTRVAAQMLTIDTQARTSMAHDLMVGRTTEVDALQGQVVRMGTAKGRKTPINARVHELVKLAELAGEGVPNLPVKAIRSNL